MKSARTTVFALMTASLAVSPLSAQSSFVNLWNACVKAEIQDRLRSQQPVRLSADRISLEGDTLRLSGRASIRFNGTTIEAEEVVIEQASKEVVLTTVRNVSIGSGSRCAPPSRRPRVEFR